MFESRDVFLSVDIFWQDQIASTCGQGPDVSVNILDRIKCLAPDPVYRLIFTAFFAAEPDGRSEEAEPWGKTLGKVLAGLKSPARLPCA